MFEGVIVYDILEFFFGILVFFVVGFCLIDRSFVVMLLMVFVNKDIDGDFFFFMKYFGEFGILLCLIDVICRK